MVFFFWEVPTTHTDMHARTYAHTSHTHTEEEEWRAFNVAAYSVQKPQHEEVQGSALAQRLGTPAATRARCSAST